jgi:hypothetical protein
LPPGQYDTDAATAVGVAVDHIRVERFGPTG